MADLNISVAAGSDDAEETSAPSVPNLTSSDLDFYNGTVEYVGIRFLNVTIPAGSTIDTVIIRGTAKTTRSGSGHTQTIYCEDIDDAPTFTAANGNISSRTKTTASASWTPGAVTANNTYDTVDFTAVLQEVIDRGGWASGQDVAVIFVGSTWQDSARDWYSFNNGSNYPQIRITYTPPAAGGAALPILSEQGIHSLVFGGVTVR